MKIYKDKNRDIYFFALQRHQKDLLGATTYNGFLFNMDDRRVKYICQSKTTTEQKYSEIQLYTLVFSENQNILEEINKKIERRKRHIIKKYEKDPSYNLKLKGTDFLIIIAQKEIIKMLEEIERIKQGE